MRKIISSIDIGSDSIKLVVGEFIDDRLHILGASKVDSNGFDNGKIVNKEEVIKAIRKAVDTVSSTLGIEIKKVILGVNLIDAKLAKSAAAIKIQSEGNIISGDNVSEVIQKTAEDKVDEGYTLIGVMPVEFLIDGDRVTDDPKGMVSENLGLKAIVVTARKDYVNMLFNIAEASGLKVVDIIPNCLGDYYSFKNKTSDSNVGIVINLGNETSSISVFNRGILTNTKTYKIGAQNIISDIGFINKIDDNTSRALYKDLTLASSRLANPNEYRIVQDMDGKQIRLSQYDLSEIAASRIDEILNLAKKQINILTKKEISYIIVSGGLTELRDFHLILESVFGKNVYLGSLNLIGVRDNSYASAVGILKYFDKKVNLRGKTFSIFSGNELNELDNGGSKTIANNNSLLGKVFGYFFDS